MKKLTLVLMTLGFASSAFASSIPVTTCVTDYPQTINVSILKDQDRFVAVTDFGRGSEETPVTPQRFEREEVLADDEILMPLAELANVPAGEISHVDYYGISESGDGNVGLIAYRGTEERILGQALLLGMSYAICRSAE